jgi:hypothetical protein
MKNQQNLQYTVIKLKNNQEFLIYFESMSSFRDPFSPSIVSSDSIHCHLTRLLHIYFKFSATVSLPVSTVNNRTKASKQNGYMSSNLYYNHGIM